MKALKVKYPVMESKFSRIGDKVYELKKFKMLTFLSWKSQFVEQKNPQLVLPNSNSDFSTPTRKEQCFQLLKTQLPYVSDYLYIQKVFSPQVEKRLDTMVEQMRRSLNDIMREKVRV